MLYDDDDRPPMEVGRLGGNQAPQVRTKCFGGLPGTGSRR
jgi:hypothetical protein